MATELKMPALSPTMEEGTLAKWLVKEGDDVKSGDILAEIETDKATMEFEAVDEGKIAKILVPEGTDGVKVGQPIALLAADGETVSDAPAAAPAEAGKSLTGRAALPQPAEQKEEATPTRTCSRRRRANSLPTLPRRSTNRKCPKARLWSARPSARLCATRWRRKCAATRASS